MTGPLIPKELAASRCTEFGQNAVIVLDYLCDPTFTTAGPPHEKDFDALADLNELERSAPPLYDALVDVDPTGTQSGHFEVHWPSFRAALPFSEGERTWLYGLKYGAQSDDTAQQLSDKLWRQEGHIVDAGIHRVVSGHELFHRWLAWRRETDQFKGQQTLDLARHALVQCVEAVTPTLPIPEPARPFK